MGGSTAPPTIRSLVKGSRELQMLLTQMEATIGTLLAKVKQHRVTVGTAEVAKEGGQCLPTFGSNSRCLPFKMMMVRMRMIALFHLKTSLTFFSLPVLFLFAHAAGMVGLRVVAF